MSAYIRSAAQSAAHPFSRLRSFEERFGLMFLTLALLVAMAMPLLAHGYKAGEIEIGHPWSRATPNGAKVAAGYLKLKNDGSEADRLISVTSDISGRAEIHEMSVSAEGVMTMRPLTDGVEIPAGGAVELKPGGVHLMFLDLKSGPKEGERFKGTLTFEKSGTVEVEFAVEAMGGKAEHDKHGGKPDGGHGAHSGH